MRLLILLGLLQTPPDILTRGARAKESFLSVMPKPQAFRVTRSNGDLMTSYHPCGCIELGLGEGIAILPCGKHRKAFTEVYRKEEN